MSQKAYDVLATAVVQIANRPGKPPEQIAREAINKVAVLNGGEKPWPN